MAEDTPMSPISEAVPPKANPLAAPASAHAATLTLNPVVRQPAAGGSATPTQTGLKPGIKLPPKPGLATAGLKLPPKPGVTATGLKPGLRLPTQTGLKPGVKLPTRPVIHKPGTVVKPAVPTAAAKPATPATPAAAPVAEMTPVADLPPVEAPKAEQPKPLEALKAVTQNLKSITSPIPQQAILRKTGIIADSEMTEAQKQAAKSKTARISLSDAMGVAPVKNEALPMKTIRIKRPVDIPGATAPAATAAPVAEPAKPVDTSAETKPAEGGEQPTTSFTQRKTLKITRPGTTVRPTGKFGVKKPTTAAPAEAKPADATADAVPEIADIPDMPTAAAPAPAAKAVVPDVPKGVLVSGLIIQIAACLVIGFLGWLLYQNTQLPYHCGGCLGM